MACPFQVPAYEYDNALAPRVRKCEFCFERVAKKGEVPACVKICPKEAITFGPRDELIALAKSKIARGTSANGGKRYLNHIYGEKEVGGTDWLYLSHVPFEDIGFLKLPEKAPPRLTESIQHGIFKYFAAPISLFAFLGGAMRLFGENDEENAGTDEEVRS
ncbi:MAG: hypothetical protein M5R36_15525 [Deltaproteobacteria bacterium]|nr:hypothetical protein [Deltaproteobacteria bacterium]